MIPRTPRFLMFFNCEPGCASDCPKKPLKNNRSRKNAQEKPPKKK
jgi:hypothetical protein